jgi:pimeloyl-ACP methyl ester carboxylesterase
MGLGRHAAHWLGFPSQLAERLGAPVIALDLPGTGTLRREPPRTDVGLIARHVADRLGPEAVRIVGISFGGMVALALAAGHPERVRSVTVVNTSAAGLAPLRSRLHLERAIAARWRDPTRREWALANLLVNDPVAAGRAAAAWTEIRRKDPVPAGTVVRHALAAARFRLPRPAAPVQVVVGRGDRLVDPRCSDAVAAALSADLRSHPWGGHALFVDAPAWLADQVAEAAVAPPQELPAPAVHP